jgi:hypothetical protein
VHGVARRGRQGRAGHGMIWRGVDRQERNGTARPEQEWHGRRGNVGREMARHGLDRQAIASGKAMKNENVPTPNT